MSTVRSVPKLQSSVPVALRALHTVLDEWRREMENWPSVEANLLLASYDICSALGVLPSQLETLLGEQDYRALLIMLGDLEDDSPPWDEA